MNNVDLDPVKSLHSCRKHNQVYHHYHDPGVFSFLSWNQKYLDIFIFVTLAVNNIPLQNNNIPLQNNNVPLQNNSLPLHSVTYIVLLL